MLFPESVSVGFLFSVFKGGLGGSGASLRCSLWRNTRPNIVENVSLEAQNLPQEGSQIGLGAGLDPEPAME